MSPLSLPRLHIPIRSPFSFAVGKERIAGLAIHEERISALFLGKTKAGEYNVLYQKHIALKPGAISRGEIKDAEELLKALKNLRDLSLHTSELVLSIPDTLSYNLLLDIPAKTPMRQIDGIVTSHLEAHSPIPLENAFWDWGEVPGRLEAKKTILVSVGPKEKIQAYLLLLEKTGFNPIAVEPHIHSLRRALKTQQEPATFLLVTVLAWGVEARILKNGVITFEHSVPFEKEAMEDFKSPEEYIAHGVNRVIEFYLSEHPTESISYFSILREDAGRSFLQKEDALTGLLEKTLGVGRRDLAPRIPALADPAFFAATGAALRGEVPRRDDKSISLAPVGTEELWRQTKLIALGRLMSDFVIIVSITLVLTFGGTWAYLNFFFQKGVQERLRVEQSSLQVTATHETIRELETNITSYNKKVADLNALYAKVPDWTIAIGEVVARTSPGIRVNAITLGLGGSAGISGTADTIGQLIDFRNILSFSGLFTTDIKIPLSFYEQKTALSFSYSLPFRDINSLFPYYFYKSLQSSLP